MLTLILFTRPQFAFSPLLLIKDDAEYTRELMLYWMLYGDDYVVSFRTMADAQEYVFFPFLEAHSWIQLNRLASSPCLTISTLANLEGRTSLTETLISARRWSSESDQSGLGLVDVEIVNGAGGEDLAV